MRLINVYFEFFKIGLFTFGGGYAIMAMIERQFVERLNWIDRREFVDWAAIAQSLPGVMAVNISTLVGYKIKGKKGALVAYLGVVTPSLIVIYLIARFLEPWMDHPLVRYGFMAINPAVLGIMAAAVWKLSKQLDVIPFNLVMGLLGTAGILLGFNPIAIIVLAGAVGYFLKSRVE